MVELIALAGILLLGVSRIRSRITLIETPDVEEVAVENLPDVPRRFYAEADARLQPLGFTPLATYRIRNLRGGNLARVYGSFTALETLSVMAVGSADPKSPHGRTVLGVMTRYEDGTQVSTSNSEGSFRFPQPAGRVRQRAVGVDDPAELLRRHREATARMANRRAVRMTREAVLAAVVDDHRRLVDHLLAIGWMRLDPRARVLRATTRMGIHAVTSHLNPLEGNFTVGRLAAGLAGGAVLPVAVLRWGLPAALAAAGVKAPADAAWWRLAALLVVFTGSGAWLGYLFAYKAFLWTFVLSFVPARIFLPDVEALFWASLWAGYVADRVFRWHARRKRVV